MLWGSKTVAGRLFAYICLSLPICYKKMMMTHWECLVVSHDLNDHCHYNWYSKASWCVTVFKYIFITLKNILMLRYNDNSGSLYQISDSHNSHTGLGPQHASPHRCVHVLMHWHTGTCRLHALHAQLTHQHVSGTLSTCIFTQVL